MLLRKHLFSLILGSCLVATEAFAIWDAPVLTAWLVLAYLVAPLIVALMLARPGARGPGVELYVMLAGMVCINTALWFCAPLLAFNPSMKLGASIRWSVYAVLSNLGALVVMGTLLGALGFVLSLPLLVVKADFVLPMIVLVFMPIVVLVNYVGYRQVFDDGAPVPA